MDLDNQEPTGDEAVSAPRKRGSRRVVSTELTAEAPATTEVQGEAPAEPKPTSHPGGTCFRTSSSFPLFDPVRVKEGVRGRSYTLPQTTKPKTKSTNPRPPGAHMLCHVRNTSRPVQNRGKNG